MRRTHRLLSKQLLGGTGTTTPEDVHLASRLLAATSDAALVKVDLRVRAEFGWTVISDIYLVEWRGDGVRIVSHGGAARPDFAARN